MERKLLRVADYLIQVNFFATEDPDVKEWFLRDFLLTYKEFIIKGSDAKIDFVINVILDKEFLVLRRSKEKSYFINYCKRTGEKQFTFFYQSSIFYFQLLLRDILQILLAKDDGFLLHSSASVINGKAFLFIGKSGAGKSTAAGLLRPKFQQFADDNLILKKVNNTYHVYQMPFFDKKLEEKKGMNSYPLGIICFLRKSEKFKLVTIKNKDRLLSLLFEQVYVQPEDKHVVLKNLFHFIEGNEIFYLLSFGKNEEKLVTLLQETSSKLYGSI